MFGKRPRLATNALGESAVRGIRPQAASSSRLTRLREKGMKVVKTNNIRVCVFVWHNGHVPQTASPHPPSF